MSLEKEYPVVSDSTIVILLPFSTVYLCELNFSVFLFSFCIFYSIFLLPLCCKFPHCGINKRRHWPKYHPTKCWILYCSLHGRHGASRNLLKTQHIELSPSIRMKQWTTQHILQAGQERECRRVFLSTADFSSSDGRKSLTWNSFMKNWVNSFVTTQNSNSKHLWLLHDVKLLKLWKVDDLKRTSH